MTELITSYFAWTSSPRTLPFLFYAFWTQLLELSLIFIHLWILLKRRLQIGKLKLFYQYRIGWPRKIQFQYLSKVNLALLYLQQYLINFEVKMELSIEFQCLISQFSVVLPGKTEGIGDIGKFLGRKLVDLVDGLFHQSHLHFLHEMFVLII